MRQRLFLGLTVLGIVLGPLGEARGHSLAAITLTQQEATEPSRTAATLYLEERLKPEGEFLSYQLTLSGNVGDIIIVGIAKEDAFAFSLDTLQLDSPTGEEIYGDYHSNYSSFDYFGSGYRAFVLTETGEYTFFLEADKRLGDPDAVYLLRMRAANDYEKLMISAENKIGQEQYEEALPLLSSAVDNAPELPSAYIARLFTYLHLVTQNPNFQAATQSVPKEDEDAIFALLYETFKGLEAETQSLVLNDLQKVEQIYTSAIANDEIEIRDEYELVLFAAVADFLETGVPTDEVRQLIF